MTADPTSSETSVTTNGSDPFPGIPGLADYLAAHPEADHVFGVPMTEIPGMSEAAKELRTVRRPKSRDIGLV